VAIAKDVGDSSKNGITRNENQIDEELTIQANKKREYFSLLDENGK
jgi:hypothetical protein